MRTQTIDNSVDRESMSQALAQLATLHKKICPRQVLGVRMGMIAGELFSLNLPQVGKRLQAFVETDGCFVDGVSVATGCTVGHRTMRIYDYGKVAATFVDTANGSAYRVAPHPQARERAKLIVPDAPSRWHAQLQAYQTMHASDLFVVESVKLGVDLAAIIGLPGIRVNCASCGEEIMNGREVATDSGAVCASCNGRAYWTKA